MRRETPGSINAQEIRAIKDRCRWANHASPDDLANWSGTEARKFLALLRGREGKRKKGPSVAAKPSRVKMMATGGRRDRRRNARNFDEALRKPAGWRPRTWVNGVLVSEKDERQYIYRITCIETGTAYIGATNSTAYRWAEHQQQLQAGRHVNKRLQRAWTKHGPTRFVFQAIEECSSVRP